MAVALFDPWSTADAKLCSQANILPSPFPLGSFSSIPRAASQLVSLVSSGGVVCAAGCYLESGEVLSTEEWAE